MIKFINNQILNEDEVLDFKGLNTDHIKWHLVELHNRESFISNLNENYTMPKHIHYMSLAEGTDFDALLVNDKMFRYTKLTEADRNDIQEYINKYAYATALVKLNECATVIGSGLNHTFTKDESYNFLSESYDKLLENISITTEKGKLVESFNSNMDVYEGVEGYIKTSNNKRIVENWKDTYNHDCLNYYQVIGTVQSGDDAIIRVADYNGAILEACYSNTPANILYPGINLPKLLKKVDLKESYRIGTLNEYNQPFTIDYATITSYNFDGDKLVTTVRDAFGNTGTLDIILNIPAKDFKKKYKGYLDGIVDEYSFGDAVDLTSDFLLNAAGDIKKINKLKNKVYTEKNSENQFLSRKVSNYVPVTEGSRNPIVVLDKEHFGVTAVDKEGKEYSIKYLYTGNQPIRDAVNDLEAEVDDYDFNSKADIISFYQLLDDYGNPLEAYPLNVSTSGRGVGGNRVIKEEAEGVQVTDIAPKLDQGELIKVTMKKRKPLKKELSIDTISEQDAFYGARGFLKDEQGRYHFGDYYITESGKVVHKSKLKEGFHLNRYLDNVIDTLRKDISEEKGIQSFSDYILYDNGTPESDFEKKAVTLDYIKKYGHDIIEDEYSKELSRLPDKGQIQQEAAKKFNWKPGEKVSDEMLKYVDDEYEKRYVKEKKHLLKKYNSYIDELAELRKKLEDEINATSDENKGERWKDWEKMKQDDDDYWAQTRGYKDWKDYEENGWGSDNYYKRMYGQTSIKESNDLEAYHKEIQNTCDEFNKKLKEIKTFADLEELEKEIDAVGEGLIFRTRRAHWCAYAFTDAGDGYVHYLLSDSVSHRKQKVTDLWKYIEVADRSR